MPEIEDPVLAEAERQVREAEERLAYQLFLINNLYAEGRRDEERKARALLGVFADLLDAARQRLRIERVARRHLTEPASRADRSRGRTGRLG
jgi:hypothetical protein